MEQSEKINFLVIWEFVKGKRFLVCCSAIFSILSSIVSFVPYWAIYKVIEALLSVYPDFSTINASEIINYGWIAFAGVTASVLLYFIALICSHLAAFGTLYKLKLNFATHLSRVPLGLHIMVGSGKLRKIMDDNIEKIENFIAHQFPDMMAAMIAPIVAFVVLFMVDWRYGLVVMGAVIISVIIQALMFQKESSKEMMMEYEKLLEDMNNGAVEYIRGISVIKAFNQTIHSFRSLRDIIRYSTKATLRYTLEWKTGMSIFSALLNNLYLFVVPMGIIFITNNQGDSDAINDFIFYLMIVPAISGILTKTMYVGINSIRIFTGIERMTDILNKKELAQPTVSKEISNYDINFENVCFSYDKEVEVIKNMSFVAKEGTITALVGPSGGGKSTIAHLIPRFFDVDSGAIKIGGTDIRDLRSEYLMDKVGFVFQDIFLFKQSLRENIKMGRADATDKDVEKAVQMAMCDDFINKLPHGLDTVLGAEGTYLSGGEMQRIAIARAIVKDAPIILLDEATAFADPENEYQIQQALKQLLKNKTVIIIAHRLYTIKDAHKILVVENGEISEQGTHDELLKNNSTYNKMWNEHTQSIGWTMQNIGSDE